MTPVTFERRELVKQVLEDVKDKGNTELFQSW